MQPLVSVCVITYNSSETIIETLESIKNQTYENLELIISDDYSKDDTCEIITQWLKDNSKRFVNANLVEHTNNSGPAINLDFAIKAANGIWIKLLAGDDLLINTAIESFIQMSTKTSSEFLVSNVEVFSKENINLDFYQNYYDKLLKNCNKSFAQKKRLITYKLFSAGPAWFFTKSLYLSLNHISPDFSMLDEWPLLYNVLMKNHDLYAENLKLVKYRVSNKSLSHTALPNKKMILQNYSFYKSFRIKQMIKNCLFLEILDQYIDYKVTLNQIAFFEKNNIIRNYTFIRIFSPIYCAKKIKALLRKK